jgi:hypothetical protein
MPRYVFVLRHSSFAVLQDDAAGMELPEGIDDANSIALSMKSSRRPGNNVTCDRPSGRRRFHVIELQLGQLSIEHDRFSEQPPKNDPPPYTSPAATYLKVHAPRIPWPKADLLMSESGAAPPEVGPRLHSAASGC